jgi:hypothetical protein
VYLRGVRNLDFVPQRDRTDLYLACGAEDLCLIIVSCRRSPRIVKVRNLSADEMAYAHGVIGITTCLELLGAGCHPECTHRIGLGIVTETGEGQVYVVHYRVKEDAIAVSQVLVHEIAVVQLLAALTSDHDRVTNGTRTDPERTAKGNLPTRKVSDEVVNGQSGKKSIPRLLSEEKAQLT